MKIDSMHPEAVYYLSGPMLGIPHHNRHCFERITAELRQRGLVIVSPHEVFGGLQTLDRERYMRADIFAVMASDAIIALPMWWSSQGAMLEISIAREIGKPVFEYRDTTHGFDLKPMAGAIFHGHAQDAQPQPQSVANTPTTNRAAGSDPLRPELVDRASIA